MEPAELAVENEVADDRSHWWIQDCIVTISPTNDLAAFAFEDRLVLLARRFRVFLVSLLDSEYMNKSSFMFH